MSHATQWGVVSGGGRATHTWTFPTSFKLSLYAVQMALRSGGSGDAVNNAFKTTSFSTTNWKGYMSLNEDVSIWLLAIGV